MNSSAAYCSSCSDSSGNCLRANGKDVEREDDRQSRGDDSFFHSDFPFALNAAIRAFMSVSSCDCSSLGLSNFLKVS